MMIDFVQKSYIDARPLRGNESSDFVHCKKTNICLFVIL